MRHGGQDAPGQKGALLSQEAGAGAWLLGPPASEWGGGKGTQDWAVRRGPALTPFYKEGPQRAWEPESPKGYITT